jgi:hypothetical protein
MSEHKRLLMKREAFKRVDDAETLRAAMGISISSDSPVLPALIVMELLLKLVYELTTGEEAKRSF